MAGFVWVNCGLEATLESHRLLVWFRGRIEADGEALCLVKADKQLRHVCLEAMEDINAPAGRVGGGFGESKVNGTALNFLVKSTDCGAWRDFEAQRHSYVRTGLLEIDSTQKSSPAPAPPKYSANLIFTRERKELPYSCLFKGRVSSPGPLDSVSSELLLDKGAPKERYQRPLRRLCNRDHGHHFVHVYVLPHHPAPNHH
jgi:hypothetical protein